MSEKTTIYKTAEINILPFEKNETEIKNFFQFLENIAETGSIIDALIVAKRIEKNIESFKTQYSKLAIDNFNGYENQFAKVIVKERSNYDYSGDFECCELELQIATLKAKLKERQDNLKVFTNLKNIDFNVEIIDEQTGEIINPLPKTITTFLEINLKK